MDFSLNEEQELFRKTVHDWVERSAPRTRPATWKSRSSSTRSSSGTR